MSTLYPDRRFLEETSSMDRVFIKQGKDWKTSKDIKLRYTRDKQIGKGTFGEVYMAKLDGEDVAIKKVLQNKQFKNRELQMMKLMNHPNICAMRAFYEYTGMKKDETYLCLVLEYVPETVYRVSRHYIKLKQHIPILQVKIYMYQLFRALAYTHALGICHRDIKPQNLLLNPITGVLKLCDFGSAKILNAHEQSVAYICSRYYRAPELIFGATYYTTMIDIWSAGCVMGELLLGQPLFPGESGIPPEKGIQQLVEIIKVLGTPSKEQIELMNPNYNNEFPLIKPYPFSKVFRSRTPPEAIDLISRILQYDPSSRLSASEALTHPFFDELRDPNTKMATGKDLPVLFNFTEMELSVRPDLLDKIVPSHCYEELAGRGIDVHDFTPLPLEQLRVISLD